MRKEQCDPQAYYRALVSARTGAGQAAWRSLPRPVLSRPGIIPAGHLSASLRQLGARAAERLAQARRRLAA